MKKILVISDLCGVGNCSLVANISVLSRLGHKVSPLATGIFSCSTGFDFFKFQRNEKLVEFAADIARADKPDAVFCGFFCDAAQLEAVKCVLAADFAKDKYLFVDPIMGDGGRLYGCFDAKFVDAMKEVVKGADCITPNLTEACFLTGKEFDYINSKSADGGFLQFVKNEFFDFLNVTGAKSAVITGIMTDSLVANLVFENSELKFVTNERLGSLHCGTGDLFASTVVGKLLNGSNLFDAVANAAQFVLSGIKTTDKDANPKAGIEFQRILI